MGERKPRDTRVGLRATVAPATGCWLWLLLTSAVAAGCEADTAERTPRRADLACAAPAQPLLGGLDFPGRADRAETCTRDERLVLRHAALLGRATVMSDAFAECVETRIDKPLFASCIEDDPGFGDPRSDRIAAVLELVRSERAGRVTCTRDGHHAGSAIVGEERHKRDGFEDIEIDIGALASEVRSGQLSSLHEIAGTLWHEAAHTVGYRDGDLEDRDPGCGFGVPYLLSFCIADTLDASADACHPGDCRAGAQLPIVSAEQIEFGAMKYQIRGGGACSCIRDPGAAPARGPEAPPSPVLERDEAGDRYGQAIATGDFNGDGLADAAIGAPGEGLGAFGVLASAGAVYAYQGTALGLYPSQMLSAADTVGPHAGAEFGFALAAADFDGDGFDDLAVGAPGGALDTGRVFLYRGSDRGLLAARVISPAELDAEETGARFAHALVQRFDGCRWGLVVAAPYASGRVEVFAGDSDPDALLAPITSLSPPELGAGEKVEQFGLALAAGRVDQDLRDDLVIGAPASRGGVGAAYLYLTDGEAPQTFGDPIALQASSAVSGFGTSLAVGRFLDPSAGSIAVGAPLSGPPTYAGAAIFYDAARAAAHAGAALSESLSWFGTRAGERAGSALQPLSTDEDAVDRLVVGAGVPAPDMAAAVRILQAGPQAVSLRQALMQLDRGSSNPSSWFGAALAAGRIVADGHDAVIIGAPFASSSPTGPRSGAALALREDGEAGYVLWKVHAQGD